MLSANFALVIFLSLKNTPLAVLSAYSYERLNGLHQIAGYTSFVYLVLHAAMYTRYFLVSDKIEILQEASTVAGIVAGFAFLGIVISAAIVRKVWYEAFYVIHIVCFIIALVCASYHQPGLEAGLIIIFGLIAAIHIGAPSRGGTKITLTKRPFGAVPGKHCFVWIPKIRMFESHPFTIVASEPLEFVVNAHDGFTRDLHRQARASPGVKLKASVDGPYGTFPDPMDFDRVVLVAGGSGASFTFGLAVNMLERMWPESTKHITFIWTVKEHDNLEWFSKHLQTLRTHDHSPKVNVSLYTTRASGTTDSDTDSRGSVGSSEHTINSPSRPIHGHDEKALEHGIVPATSEDSMATAYSLASAGSTQLHRDIKAGRPDTAALIREAVSSTPSHQRVLVAACGPDGLMRVVRDTTASLIRGDGPGVELHCEQFGW
ncbi:hypothetical protein SLS53_002312 [Cytospora paraplurivora]|uniref:FAD-binding FR-type domain-containing protein n=1 Tax=Cytospora paraplurivora TaxID=2898453 RepID=A0AAN9UES3_9PEZI